MFSLCCCCCCCCCLLCIFLLFFWLGLTPPPLLRLHYDHHQIIIIIFFFFFVVVVCPAYAENNFVQELATTPDGWVLLTHALRALRTCWASDAEVSGERRTKKKNCALTRGSFILLFFFGLSDGDAQIHEQAEWISHLLENVFVQGYLRDVYLGIGRCVLRLVLMIDVGCGIQK